MPALSPSPAAAQRPPRRLQRLRAAESMRLLGGVPLGRVVFTAYGVPTVRPVNHVVDGGDVLFRTHGGSAVVEAALAGGVTAAYEADELDVVSRLGWSVAVTGHVSLVDDPDEAARMLALIEPWLDSGADKDRVIRIRPQVVFGFRVLPASDAA